jgi:2-polyprenyl-6-methoxyphenol hydroxylase-like FAD-dependent oxidoreductase
MNIITQHRSRVVVLGAGFGGLTFCKNFECPNAEVTLVDRQNHHLFQPLLYQVATEGASIQLLEQGKHGNDWQIIGRDSNRAYGIFWLAGLGGLVAGASGVSYWFPK